MIILRVRNLPTLECTKLRSYFKLVTELPAECNKKGMDHSHLFSRKD